MRSVTRVALQPIAQGSACILEEQQQQQAEEEDAEEDRKEAEGRERQAAQVSNKRSLNIISLHHQLLLLLPVDGPALRIRNVQYFSASHKDFCKAGEWVRGRG